MFDNYDGDYNYLRDTLDIDPIETRDRFDRCLEAMQKYATPWWHELRGAALVAMQLKEPVLLIPAQKLKEGVELVLERRVQDFELSFDNKTLLEEFERAYAAIAAN